MEQKKRNIDLEKYPVPCFKTLAVKAKTAK